MKLEQIAHNCWLSGIQETRYITAFAGMSYYCSSISDKCLWLPFNSIEITQINPFDEANGRYLLKEGNSEPIPPSIAKMLQLAFPAIINAAEKFQSLKHLLISSVLGSPLWDGVNGRKFKASLQKQFPTFYASWTEEFDYQAVAPGHNYNDLQIPKIFEWVEERNNQQSHRKMAEKVAGLLLKCGLLQSGPSVIKLDDDRAGLQLPKVPSSNMLGGSLLQLYQKTKNKSKPQLTIVLPDNPKGSKHQAKTFRFCRSPTF